MLSLAISRKPLSLTFVWDLFYGILRDLCLQPSGQFLYERGETEYVTEALRALGGVDLGDHCR